MAHDKEVLHQPTMVLISFVQGLCLLGLYKLIEYKIAIYDQPQWMLPIFSITIIVPTILLLSIHTKNIRRLFLYTTIFACVIFIMGLYTGYQTVPRQYIHAESVYFIYAATLLLASFKALLYIQIFSSNESLKYSSLYLLSWRNALIIALTGIFVGIFFALLMLWANLFKIINITFFFDLFLQKWFLIPILSIAFGIGVKILRKQTHIIQNISFIQQSLIQYLLPILLFIAVIFLIAIPFQGLGLLWETGKGSALILWLMALTLFFINAAYQDGINLKRYYPEKLDKFVSYSLCIFPIYSAIAYYGLMIRIEQYGLTLSRAWGLIIWLILSLFALFYTYSIIKYKIAWIQNLSKINIRMGLFIATIMMLINTPLFDVKKIIVAHQLSRLESKQVSPKDFDFAYFKRYLAKPGYDALQKMKHSFGEKNEENKYIIKRINSLYRLNKKAKNHFDYALVMQNIVKIPENLIIPPTLNENIIKYLKQHTWQLKNIHELVLIQTDLSTEHSLEYALIFIRLNYADGQLFYFEDEKWVKRHINLKGKFNADKLLNTLNKNQISAKKRHWKDLYIGEAQFRIND